MNIELNQVSPKQSPNTSSQLNSDLSINGYTRFSISEQINENTSPEDIEQFLSVFTDMPLDPYDKTASRYRFYGRAVYFPWDSSLHWIPPTKDAHGQSICHYFQGPYNPEHVDELRHFSAIPEYIVHNPVVTEIVDYVTSLTYFNDFDRCRPCLVGIHFISQQVDQTHPEAVVSPNCMHQDGEMFDFVVLVGRENVGGGKNYIGDASHANESIASIPAAKLLESFTLEQPFEGFCVEDVRVSHGVTPVHLLEGAKSGYRRTMLLDVTPLTEDLRA